MIKHWLVELMVCQLIKSKTCIELALLYLIYLPGTTCVAGGCRNCLIATMVEYGFYVRFSTPIVWSQMVQYSFK